MYGRSFLKKHNYTKFIRNSTNKVMICSARTKSAHCAEVAAEEEEDDEDDDEEEGEQDASEDEERSEEADRDGVHRERGRKKLETEAGTSRN